MPKKTEHALKKVERGDESERGITMPIDSYIRERLTRDYEEAAIAKVQAKAGQTKDRHAPVTCIRDPEGKLRFVAATSDEELEKLWSEARDQGAPLDIVLLPKPDDATLARLTTARATFSSLPLPASEPEEPARRALSSGEESARSQPPSDVQEASTTVGKTRGGGNIIGVPPKVGDRIPSPDGRVVVVREILPGNRVVSDYEPRTGEE